MALSSNLTTFSDVTDNAPLSPSYLNSKFGILDKNILQINTSPQADNIFHIEDPAYGAVGDGTTDDTAAINAAATACIAADGILTGTPGTTYRLDGAVSFEGLKYCDFTGVRFRHWEDDGVALTIGGGSAPSTFSAARLILPELVGHTVAGTPSGTGLQVKAIRSSYVYIPLVQSFDIGVNVTSSDSTAVVYITFEVLNVTACRKGLIIKPHDATAWCNECTWRGGRIALAVAAYSQDAGNHLLQIEKFTAGQTPDNWLFERVAFEASDIPTTIDLINSRQMHFLSCRWENATNIALGADAKDTLFNWGKDINVVIAASNYNDSGVRNYVVEPHTWFPMTAGSWAQDNVAASQSGVELTSDARWMAPRDGAVTGIVIKSTESRTAGQLQIHASKTTLGIAGAPLGQYSTIVPSLETNNVAMHFATTKPGDSAFSAGDEIALEVTTSSSWAPTTADVRAWMEVVLYGR